MTRKIFALITIVFLTSSCSVYHVNSVDSTDNFYPSKSPEEVVYLESITQPHEVIGTVTVNSERKQRSIDDVIIKMKREAAVLGGNAITNLRTDATGAWKNLPIQNTIGNAYVRSNFTASVAIVEGSVSEDQASEDLITEDLITEDLITDEPVVDDSPADVSDMEDFVDEDLNTEGSGLL